MSSAMKEFVMNYLNNIKPKEDYIKKNRITLKEYILYLKDKEDSPKIIKKLIVNGNNHISIYSQKLSPYEYYYRAKVKVSHRCFKCSLGFKFQFTHGAKEYVPEDIIHLEPIGHIASNDIVEFLCYCNLLTETFICEYDNKKIISHLTGIDFRTNIVIPIFDINEKDEITFELL